MTDKQRFRDEHCNIVTMSKSKIADVPKGYTILRPLQSQEEFNKVADSKNWAITQTKDSNVLFFDLENNKSDPKLNKFFNRRRDRYENHSELIDSKHGFLKVINADHQWCVEFAKKYHVKCGIEIYAEKHWVIYAGSYYNTKNIDDPKRITTWYPLDDLHKDPIIKVTKEELGNVLGVIAPDIEKQFKSKDGIKARKTTRELLGEDWAEGERYANFRDLALRRFHEGKSDEEVRTEAYKKNRTLTKCHDLDEVDRGVNAGYEIYQNNVKDPDSKYFEKEDNSDFQNINYEDKKKKEIDIYEIAYKLMSEYTFITLEKSKEILFYKDGIYQNDGENIISKRTRKIEDGIKLNHINEIKGIIKDETGYVSHDDFDKEEYKINLKNKTINLKSGKVSDHSPDYLSRVKIPVFYNPEAKCPRFDKFLSDSLDGDEPKIRTVLEMMALCLLKDNSLVQKAFMNTGKGSNGKSVLFGILVALLGKLNVSAKTIHDFEKNHFASSSLEGKLANICADVGNKGISSTESLKKLIGGDPVDCERKFMEGYTFTPYATLIFSANDIPEVSDESDGFARRFELIEWEKSFYGKDRDNSIKTIRKDPGEISGLFNKLMPICKELLENHALRYESTVEDAKIKWLKKSDSTQRFINEKCSINPEYWCPIAEIYGNYTKFAKELGMTPLNDRKFNAKLESQSLSRTVKRVDGASIKVWIGITLSSKLAKKSGNSTLAS